VLGHEATVISFSRRLVLGRETTLIFFKALMCLDVRQQRSPLPGDYVFGREANRSSITGDDVFGHEATAIAFTRRLCV